MNEAEQVEIDPSEAMNFLEDTATAANERSSAIGTDAGTNANASTNAQTNSTTGDNAGAGSSATDVNATRTEGQSNATTNNSQVSTQANNQNAGSLFDQAAQRSTARTFEPLDDDLVMIGDQLVPFKQVRESAVLKPRYDAVVTERNQLRNEVGAVREEKRKIDAVQPFIKTLEGDIFGRTYIETLTLTGDPERSRRAAEAAAGLAQGSSAATQAGNQQQQDPRLVPPKDETGEPLPKDHPDYLAWLTGPNAQANAEIGTRKVLAEAEAKAEAKARTEREAADIRTRQTREQTEQIQRIDTHNKTQLNRLDPELRKRGFAIEKMTPEEWSRAQEIVINAVKKHGIDLRDDNALRQRPLMEGFMGLVLNDEKVVTQIRGINPTLASDRGPERAAEQTQQAGGQQAATQQNGQTNGNSNGNQNTGRYPMRNSFGGRQPLSAGQPSEAIAGRASNTSMDTRSDEDQTQDAMSSLL
jgi:hypothetical protein